VSDNGATSAKIHLAGLERPKRVGFWGVA
jgi:hypothetical protein